MSARTHLTRSTSLAMLGTVALLVVACGGSTGTAVPTAEVAPTVAPSAASPAVTPSPPASASEAPPPSPVALTQSWATAPLVDVTSNETFRIADHAGKVVIVEPMAIWCTNCLAQQREVEAALDRLSSDSVVYVILDVDPNENGASLALYRERNGFGGRYAVAGSDVARALAADFGDQFLNPVATPMIVISTDGTVTLTEFGPKSADEIIALAQAAEA